MKSKFCSQIQLHKHRLEVSDGIIAAPAKKNNSRCSRKTPDYEAAAYQDTTGLLGPVEDPDVITQSSIAHTVEN